MTFDMADMTGMDMTSEPAMITQAFIYLWFIDCVLPKGYPRWFMLHIVSNTFVCIFSFTDVWFLLGNPLHYTLSSSSVPRAITFALHMYHIVVIRKLSVIDWVHHVVMTTVLLISCFYVETITISNYNLFFTTGLPGGIDYVLLAMMKMGKLDKITEKKINSKLNVWIRGPGIIIGAYILFLQHSNNVIPTSQPLLWFIIPALLWNAQYFTERVVYNYGRQEAAPQVVAQVVTQVVTPDATAPLVT